MILICVVFAFVCFALGAFNVGSPRFNLMSAGLAFYMLSLLIAAGGFK
jgi:hypothetical protein